MRADLRAGFLLLEGDLIGFRFLVAENYPRTVRYVDVHLDRLTSEELCALKETTRDTIVLFETSRGWLSLEEQAGAYVEFWEDRGKIQPLIAEVVCRARHMNQQIIEGYLLESSPLVQFQLDLLLPLRGHLLDTTFWGKGWIKHIACKPDNSSVSVYFQTLQPFFHSSRLPDGSLFLEADDFLPNVTIASEDVMS